MKIEVIIFALLRHIMTSAGVGTAAIGDDALTQIAGGLAAAIGFGWSLWDKKGR